MGQELVGGQLQLGEVAGGGAQPERTASLVSRETAGILCDDDMSAEVVATEIGTTKALVLLVTAQ
ncbi:hypothetical protein [Streptomyces virginiae]|uniref:Uncharacterized protein n=1 Tax=Streptomyces virginiae TaxID=1961 RepID=A0ABZ1T4F3_STRVG|nr:hypothetical protein [Streptomyces virginiae]